MGLRFQRLEALNTVPISSLKPCIRATCVWQAGPFPAGLVLHSWAGSAEVTKQLAEIEGVYFSISGHTFNLSDKKLTPMLQQVRLASLPYPFIAGAVMALTLRHIELVSVIPHVSSGLIRAIWIWMIAEAAQVPLDRLLLETDSPDGLPALLTRHTAKQEVLTVPGSDRNEDGNHPANIRCIFSSKLSYDRWPCKAVTATCTSI